MRTRGGEGSVTKLLGGSYPSSAENLLQQRHWQGLLLQHCWLLMARQPRLPDWAWQNCCWKSIIHFLSLLSRFIWSREPKLRHPEGKNRWVPSLAAELAARDNACSGSFCNKHGEVGTGVFSSLLLKLPFLSIFQARRGYLSWQPWKSSTIWCLYVCRGSTEGFSVTDEICSPSNTPAKEILPLESQTIRFLLQRCLIPGNWVLWEN